MTKLKFIDSSRNKKEKDENTVETIITEMMIFKFEKLLIDAKIFERCANAAFFSHQKSLLSALYIITVFNARTL